MPDDTPSRDPPRKPRGRPPLVERGTAVTVWVSSAQHDRLSQVASKRGESLSGLLRGWLDKRLG
jgi:hypothetical protein